MRAMTEKTVAALAIKQSLCVVCFWVVPLLISKDKSSTEENENGRPSGLILEMDFFPFDNDDALF